MTVKTSDKNIYCISFGIAYHAPDKFCDPEFPFELLKRLVVKEVKNTTRMNPTSNRRRMIDSFITSNMIDFNAGDSIQKVKFTIDREYLSRQFKGYFPAKDNIEIGSSLKLYPINQSLECILDCILGAERIINEMPQVTDIPHLVRIKDDDEIRRLVKSLDNAKLNQINLSLPDFRIIGTKLWDYSEITSIEYKYQKTRKSYSELTISNLFEFMSDNNFKLSEIVDHGEVIIESDSDISRQMNIIELIEYVDEKRHIVLIDGKWHKFNDDYIHYINEEIRETKIVRINEFDYLNKQTGANKRLTEGEFNRIVSQKSGYILLDKQLTSNKLGKYELCDLFNKEAGSMIAVKNVNDSKSFCYVIDQSEMATKALKAKSSVKLKHVNETVFWKSVQESAIWIVLNRAPEKQLCLDEEGRPMIENLNYFLAKMKIPTWKRTIRNLNRTPVIYVSYR